MNSSSNHFEGTEYGYYVHQPEYTFHTYSKQVRKAAKKSVKWPVLIFFSLMLITAFVVAAEKNREARDEAVSNSQIANKK